jgi:hypothetical protein
MGIELGGTRLVFKEEIEEGPIIKAGGIQPMHRKETKRGLRIKSRGT